jgi:hypothetical protein
MKISYIIILAISMISLFAGTASAVNINNAKPGSIIPLTISGYEMTTTGLIITPSWRPALIKWYLIDPQGNTKNMVGSTIDTVTQTGSGFNSATWSITDNAGTMKMPAFAQKGTWILRGRIYDINKVFIFQFSNKAEFTAAVIEVGDASFIENLYGPLYWYTNLGGNMLTGDMEFAFGTPDVIILLLAAIIIVIISINVVALRRRKKE